MAGLTLEGNDRATGLSQPLLGWRGGGVLGGGGGIPCLRKYDSTNSGATKSVPFLKNERTNYV